jgi:hypothetical protein
MSYFNIRHCFSALTQIPYDYLVHPPNVCVRIKPLRVRNVLTVLPLSYFAG